MVGRAAQCAATAMQQLKGGNACIPVRGIRRQTPQQKTKQHTDPSSGLAFVPRRNAGLWCVSTRRDQHKAQKEMWLVSGLQDHRYLSVNKDAKMPVDGPPPHPPRKAAGTPPHQQPTAWSASAVGYRASGVGWPSTGAASPQSCHPRPQAVLSGSQKKKEISHL